MNETISVRLSQSRPITHEPLVDNKIRANKTHLDSIASFNENEDKLLKKLRPDLAPSFGIPQLNLPSPIITDEENFAIDSVLEKEIFTRKNEHRESYNESSALIIKEIRYKQLQQKRLHGERDQFLKELEERAKTSEALRWLQGGSSIAMLGLGVLAFAVAIFTGGMGVLGVLAAIAGGVSGVVSGIGGLEGLKTQEVRAIADKLKTLGEMEHAQVNTLLGSAGNVVVKTHAFNDLCAKDARNRFGVKIF